MFSLYQISISSFSNGLISNLHGPYERKIHDNVILRHSDLLEQLQKHAQTPNREPVLLILQSSLPLTNFFTSSY